MSENMIFGPNWADTAGCPKWACKCGLREIRDLWLPADPHLSTVEARSIFHSIKNLETVGDFNALRNVLHERRIMLKVWEKWKVLLDYRVDFLCDKIAKKIGAELTRRLGDETNTDLLARVLDESGLFHYRNNHHWSQIPLFPEEME